MSKTKKKEWKERIKEFIVWDGTCFLIDGEKAEYEDMVNFIEQELEEAREEGYKEGRKDNYKERLIVEFAEMIDMLAGQRTKYGRLNSKEEE